MEKKVLWILFLFLVSMQWYAALVESANDSEAKVTGATQKTDNQYMSVVKDEEAKSGWSINVPRAFSENQLDGALYVIFLTRTDPKGEFEKKFFFRFCDLLTDGIDTLLPKQILDMIFPKQKNSCKFEAATSPILANAQVNTNADDNWDIFPKSTPYQMEVRILNNDQAHDPDGDDDYLFKVNFDIGGDINKK